MSNPNNLLPTDQYLDTTLLTAGLQFATPTDSDIVVLRSLVVGQYENGDFNVIVVVFHKITGNVVAVPFAFTARVLLELIAGTLEDDLVIEVPEPE